MSFGSALLNDGNKLPLIAFGTGSALFGKDATEAVERALEQGFEHLDTAAIYQNEESVGLAIKESGLARGDLFVTTKYGGGNIQDSIRTSLRKLGLEYVDLYLIHNPKYVGNDLEGAWREFEKIKEDGLAKSIGVSNFSLEQLQQLVKFAKIKPAVNQIQYHAYNHNENSALLAYSASQGIITAAYSGLTPLTRAPGGPVDEPVRRAAERRGASPAQVHLLWLRAKGVAIVTTSSRKERLQEYLAAADLVPLTPDEVAAIDTAGAQGPPAAASGWTVKATLGFAALVLIAYQHWKV